MNIHLKKRTRLQRLIRLPKVIKANWKFAKNAKFFDRISFVWRMIKVIMK